MHSLVIGPFPELWPPYGTAAIIDDYCMSNDQNVLKRNIKFDVLDNFYGNQKHNDYLYAQITRLYSVFFKELARQLNLFHQVDHSHRSWSIVISHWLMRSIEDLVKAYTEVGNAIDNHQFQSVFISSSKTSAYTPSSSIDYSMLRRTEEYVVLLRSEAIRHLNAQSLIPSVKETEITNPKRTIGGSKKEIRTRLLIELNQIVARIGKRISRRAEIYVSSSYLPIWSEIILKLSLGLIPTIRTISKFDSGSTDSQFRSHIFDGLRMSQPLDDFVSSQLRWMIPRTYLEDYESLNVLIDTSSWPDNPKVIFTANSFDTDDEFKIWTAQKARNGSIYVVMQHGNNFGTYRYPIHPEIEFADYFLTWGWKNQPKEIPLFCQTVKHGKKHRSRDNQSLLILRRQIPMRESITDHPNRLRDSLQEENYAFELLSENIRSATWIKSHPASKYKKDIYDYDKDAFKLKKQFLDDSIPTKKIYTRYKLVYFECYSTGVLECLSLNVPTIFIWPEGIESLRSESVDDFRVLKDNGILFFSAAEAATHINEIWSNVSGWWSNTRVQEARNDFVTKHARGTGRPIRNIRKILKEFEKECV